MTEIIFQEPQHLGQARPTEPLIIERQPKTTGPMVARPDVGGVLLFPWHALCNDQTVIKNGLTCEFDEVFYTREAAEWALAHHEHLIYPTKRYNYMSTAEQLWVELDRVVDQIMDPANAGLTEAVHKAKGRAAGLAFGLVLMCQPYYADETAVSRESLKRWEMRNGKREWEPTAGFKYSPPIPGTVENGLTDRVNQRKYSKPDSPAPTYGKSELQSVMSKLGTTKVGQIKQGINSGMFSAKDLAGVYGVTVEMAEAIAKS